MYASLKLLHVTLATVSISGFLLRAWWSINASPLLETRLARTAPHVVDTLFLLAGIGMIWSASLPVADLIKRGRTRQTRIMATILAVGLFAWVVGISIRKSPLGWLTPLVG